MQIEIGNFVITSDPLNVILSEKKTRKDGKNAGEIYLDLIGYYTTLSDCLEGLVEYSVRISEATSVKQLMEEIRDIKKLIGEKLNGI